MLIYETENFIVESHEKPFVSRTEGGHIRIKIKDESIIERTQLSPSQAIEYIRLTMVVGKAMEEIMNRHGIPVIKVNYQDMGNWATKKGNQSYLHCHVMGRAKNAKKQPWPEAVYLPDRGTGFYDDFEPLDEEDVKMIREEIEKIFTEEKYQDKNWHL